ncbi:DUF1062 domain-containing protein [Pleomorphomonas sp. PLEO]|uniref:DUF1062 domain-containing protein n=1 Tax=Pleomorphomonas sp. PLEO TaxID=3239306 RepID=UPI00351E9944
MSDHVLVRWTIVPRDCPRPVLACPTCGDARPFHPSGKIRLNANGKRLDAWLIYKCDDCDRTWNRPIFERRLATEVPPDELAALRTGDPAFVRRLAFDLPALRRKTSLIVQSDTVEIERVVVGGKTGATGAEIALAVPYPVGLRLDRLLASELDLARNRIAALAGAGRLTVIGGGNALNRPPRDGQIIRLDLVGVEDAPAIVAAAG